MNAIKNQRKGKEAEAVCGGTCNSYAAVSLGQWEEEQGVYSIITLERRLLCKQS